MLLTLPCILRVANESFEAAIRRHADLHRTINVYRGQLIHRSVARSLGRSWTPLEGLVTVEV